MKRRPVIIKALSENGIGEAFEGNASCCARERERSMSRRALRGAACEIASAMAARGQPARAGSPAVSTDERLRRDNEHEA